MVRAGPICNGEKDRISSSAWVYGQELVTKMHFSYPRRGLAATAVKVKEQSVVVFDPSPLWLNAVEEALSANGEMVVGLAPEPEQALALIEEHKPGLLIVDPAAAGIDLIRGARARFPELKVIALGAPADADQVSAVLAAGAAAFVVKGERPDSAA